MNRQERRRQKKLQGHQGGGRPLKDDAAQNLFQQAMGIHQQGDAAGALALYKQILDNNPQHADTLALAGMACCQTSNLKSGIDYLQQSIAIVPNNLDAQFNLGQAFEASERYEEAIGPYQKVAEIEPGNADVHFHHGTIYHSLGQDEDAVKHLRHMIAITPNHADAHANLGIVLKDLNQFDEAEASIRKALSLKGDDNILLSNLGNLLKEQNRIEESAAAHRKALALKPDYAEGHSNLGSTLVYQGKLDEAIEHFERALALKPDLIEARSNYAKALLKSGRFQDGWREYRTRWDWKGYGEIFRRSLEQKRWEGESLDGKSILVWNEQGIGDEIMFANTFPDLLDRAKEVFVECESRLVPLFERSFPGIQAFARDNPPDATLNRPDIDYQIAAGDLGQYLRPNLESFPKHTGYIKPDPQNVSRLRERYLELGKNTFVVGINWKSGNPYVANKNSAEFELWEPVLSCEDCFFVNLQYGNVKPILDPLKDATGIQVYHDEEVDPLNNMDLFAAQIAAMDLVISIDNSTVHLTGALGAPVWTPAVRRPRLVVDAKPRSFAFLSEHAADPPGKTWPLGTRIYHCRCEPARIIEKH